MPLHERRDRLETIVDETDIGHVVDLLSEIAVLKAEHLATDWQDEEAAKMFMKIADILEHASLRIAEI